MSKFTLFKKGNPCPICQSNDARCKEGDELILCMSLLDAVEVPGYRFIGLTSNQTWGKWAVDDGQHWTEQQREQWRQEKDRRRAAESQRKVDAMPAVERDVYYRRLLPQLALHSEDLADLRRRGLKDQEISAWGVKSVSQWQTLERELSHNLPGVNLDGRSLNTPGGGYLCPIPDVNGRIVGLQIRLRNTSEEGRYRWLTSSTKKRTNGPTPHLPNGELPLAVFRPKEVMRQAIALVEGTGAKPYITSLRRGQVAIGAAGGQFPSSPETLKTTLFQLSDELGTRVDIEFYPDAGAVGNPHVLRQYRATWMLLRKWGYRVKIAWWGQIDKGIHQDVDELKDHSQIRFITVAQFEEIAQTFQPLSQQDIQKAVEHEKWLEQISQQAKQSWVRSKRFTPTDRVNEQFVSTGLAEILQADIHAQRSTMGTGKTQAIARMLKDWRGGVVVLGSRNSLLLQSCERWGNVYHLRNDDAHPLVADPDSRIACCLDSLKYFKPSDFRGKVLVLDEVFSTVIHGLFSSTLNGKRPPVLKLFEQAVQNATAVVAWDGNCCDIAINYLASLRGENCRVIKRLNEFTGQSLNVEIVRSVTREFSAAGETVKVRLRDHSPVTSKLKECLEAYSMLPAGTGRAISVVSDNQRFLEALDGVLSASGAKVFRVDSKTVTSTEVKQFLKSPDAYLVENPCDVVMLSPTAESGIDISIQNYFLHGFGYFFGIVGTDTQIQMLRRFRAVTDWSVFCQEYTTLEDSEGSRSPFARRLNKQMLDYFEMDAIAALEGTDREVLARDWFRQFREQCQDKHWETYIKLQAARNYERSHTRECLEHQLKDGGHQVTIIDADPDRETKREIDDERKAIILADASAIFHADDIGVSLEDAFRIKSSFSASLEDQWKAEKVLLKYKLPGIENTPAWSVDFVADALFRDRSLIPQLQRYWLLKHMDVAKAKAAQSWQELLDGKECLFDSRSDFMRLKGLNHLNILKFVDGQAYSPESSEVQELFRKCKHSKKLQIALGRSPGKLQPMDWLGRVLSSVGIVSRRNRRQKTYTYVAPESDPTKAAILECLERRFLLQTSKLSETSAEQSSGAIHLPLKSKSNMDEGGSDQTLTQPSLVTDLVGSGRYRWGSSLAEWEILSVEGAIANIHQVTGWASKVIKQVPLSELRDVV